MIGIKLRYIVKRHKNLNSDHTVNSGAGDCGRDAPAVGDPANPVHTGNHTVGSHLEHFTRMLSLAAETLS